MNSSDIDSIGLLIRTRQAELRREAATERLLHERRGAASRQRRIGPAAREPRPVSRPGLQA